MHYNICYKLPMYLLLGLLLFLSNHTWAQEKHFSLALDTQNLSTNEQVAVQKFLVDTQQLLPEKMLQGIGRAIDIHFVDFGTKLPLTVPCQSDSQQNANPKTDGILGRLLSPWYLDHTKYHTIEINRAFIPDIMAGPEQARPYACGHKNYYRLAQATLVHELAHVYDFSDLYSVQEKAILKDCSDFYPDDPEWPGRFDPNICKNVQKIIGQVSDREPFRQRTGWFEGIFPPAQEKNRQTNRSPDPYEISGVQEFFAVNMEYFLLDPNYACRRPALYEFYAKTFAINQTQNCSVNYNVYGAMSGVKMNIDPARVYEIHYLYAGQGDAIMSHWGHGMFRIIVCAPTRKEVSAECLKDTSYHVIASYRANIADLIIDYWAGFWGHYPSQLFFYPLTQVVDEYTRDELREVSSLPLRLSVEQKKLLLDFLVEQYWQYTGRYYFLTNNCGTEALDSLRAILPTDHPLQKSSALSPEGLYDDLIASGLGNSSVLSDKEQARLQGFYFPPLTEALNKSLQGIGWSKGIESYYNDNDAQARNKLFNQKTQNISADQKRVLAAHFAFLELHAQRLQNHLLDETMTELSLDLTENDGQVANSLQKGKADLSNLSPWHYIKNLQTSYGVPTIEEVGEESEILERYIRYGKDINELQELLKPQIPELFTEALAIEKNLGLFISLIKPH